jgi:hypothetical protein
MNLMKQYGPLIITLVGTIGAAVFTPAFIAAHPFAFAVVEGLRSCCMRCCRRSLAMAMSHQPSAVSRQAVR